METPDPGIPRSTPPKYVPPPEQADVFDPASFDSPWVRIAAPPLVAGLAVLITMSPLGTLLRGFHVWTHEFGHATVAWMTGYKALPLPIGWTNTSPEKSLFVYFGLLFLFVVLLVAGCRERKPWPVFFAICLAGAQAWMTWRLPDDTANEWRAFAGLGGEFYLSAAMVAAFNIRLPEKFKWGWCRYAFLFWGATSFYSVWSMWRQVRYGQVPLPYGSMVNGEVDAGGDLNILSEDHGWRDREIIATYHELGQWCLVAMLAAYLVFAMRLDRLPALLLRRKAESKAVG